jgi:nicotianamine synthase
MNDLTTPPHRKLTELRRLYAQLADRPSLAPEPAVDELFGRLVELVVTMGEREAGAVLADPAVRAMRPHLQRLCAQGETELERAWAARIVRSRRPADELERFPYVENYRRLTRLEWSAVAAAGQSRPRRVAVVGSGPLPLSVVLLARRYGVAVDGFDRDRRAVVQSRALVRALGVRRVVIHHADTCRCPDLRRYDVVVLAALVGATPPAKRAAVQRVHARMRPGALLAARSAHAARSLLYPVLDLEALADLELLSVVHPYDQVVNSVVVARKRPG